jgi:two-component system sensor kinase FixL
VYKSQLEASLRAVIDTVADGIVIIDETGAVQLFNKGCTRLFGYAADEVLGQNVKMLMPPPYHAQHDSYLDRYHVTGERRIIDIGRQVQGRRADGSIFPMYLSVGEIPTIESRKLFVGVIHDLTEQRAAEAELRAGAERLRSIIETVPDAIIVIDDRGSIESFSPAAERLFGWTEAEVKDRNIKMLMPPPYREQHDSYLERYATTGERRIIGIGRIVVGLRSDGSTFPMELAVGEMHLSERRLFTGFVRDLSERQSTEKRLQELQLELLHFSRLSAMGQMASALAHELNQPLTAVINWAQAARRILQTDGGDVPPKALDFMEKAIDQAGRAGQIIRRLRSFIEKSDTDRQLEDANKVVEEATLLALVGAKESGVRVMLGFRPGLPPVLIDKVQVQQVVINLIRNAIEAMAQSDRRELVVDSALAADGMVEIRVADTGPGLGEEVLARLFQPFVTTKAKGMGLGLSISRTIIDNHGGLLRAAPNPGGGVIFSFTLPQAELGKDEGSVSDDG